jgi:hypothetical protein
LQALALTASCFSTGMSVTFFQGSHILMSGRAISAWACGKNRPGSPDGNLGHSADFSVHPDWQVALLRWCHPADDALVTGLASGG